MWGGSADFIFGPLRLHHQVHSVVTCICSPWALPPPWSHSSSGLRTRAYRVGVVRSKTTPTDKFRSRVWVWGGCGWLGFLVPNVTKSMVAKTFECLSPMHRWVRSQKANGAALGYAYTRKRPRPYLYGLGEPGGEKGVSCRAPSNHRWAKHRKTTTPCQNIVSVFTSSKPVV